MSEASPSEFSTLVDTIKKSETRWEWDEYFMLVAHLVSKRSSCDRLNVGCVITKDKRIISTGYNGHVQGAPHESVVRDGHEQLTIHAEVNAVAHAARTGTGLNEATAYTTHFPCINCAKTLLASGVSEIVYGDDYKNDELVYGLLESKGVTLRQKN